MEENIHNKNNGSTFADLILLVHVQVHALLSLLFLFFESKYKIHVIIPKQLHTSMNPIVVTYIHFRAHVPFDCPSLSKTNVNPKPSRGIPTSGFSLWLMCIVALLRDFVSRIFCKDIIKIV